MKRHEHYSFSPPKHSSNCQGGSHVDFQFFLSFFFLTCPFYSGISSLLIYDDSCCNYM
uniref:Uncharacterized protein n=1 Tax=Lepeophtheirus salmonis TaxID=72036 RepID=A0A0K2SYD7_LEPSM